ncbi:unnamed protein product [Closterium sp. Naga37s-1]|nr:unnamed protein product [Closterium sp. Naga37s-1]
MTFSRSKLPCKPCKPVGAAGNTATEEMERIDGGGGHPVNPSPLSPRLTSPLGSPTAPSRANPLSPRGCMSPTGQDPTCEDVLSPSRSGAAAGEAEARSELRKFRLHQSKGHRRHGALAFLASEPAAGSGSGSAKAGETGTAGKHLCPPSTCNAPNVIPSMHHAAAANGQAEAGKERGDGGDAWDGWEEGSGDGVAGDVDDPQLELYRWEGDKLEKLFTAYANKGDKLEKLFTAYANKGDKLEKLFAAYANKVGGAPVGSFKFVFDGEALRSDSTPAEVDLDDEDQIEAVRK